MAQKNGGALVVVVFEKHNIDLVFGLSGGHIFPIEEALERSSIRYVTTRHEQAAVFMAEAYGEKKRKPGVAIVTAGAGFTNSLSAVQSAYMSNVPLLLIAGAVGLKTREKIDLQDVTQLPVITPIWF
jgi:acetolactate synthase I/II/III large subunit